MKCAEVYKRLSAYIEKNTTPAQRARIDDHLKGCKRCARALADLQKTIEHVKRLEEVEPPAWLAEKVAARVREEAEAQRGIWQKLFYPFHIKLPIEALAVIFLAVGTIYIFKAVQPETRLARVPIETRESASRAKEPEKQKVAAKDQERPALAKPAGQSVYDKKIETREKQSFGAIRTPVDKAKREEGAPSAGASYRDESLQTFAPSAKGVGRQKAAAVKAKGVNFVVNARDLEIASRDIEAILRQLGGRTIKTEPLGDKAVIAAEISTKKMKELFEQLNLIGEVQVKENISEEAEGAVDIRVEVVIPPRQP